jgi:hypothetical protein
MIRCKSASFTKPGPSKPGVNNDYMAYVSDNEYLIVLDPSCRAIHVQKRDAKGVPGGTVRSVDQTHAYWEPFETPAAVEAFRSKEAKK